MNIAGPRRGVLALALIAALGAPIVSFSRLQQAPEGPQTSAPPPRDQHAPPPVPARPPPEYAITVESALVNLDVLVTDEGGRVLSELKKENFRVLDN